MTYTTANCLNKYKTDNYIAKLFVANTRYFEQDKKDLFSYLSAQANATLETASDNNVPDYKYCHLVGDADISCMLTKLAEKIQTSPYMNDVYLAIPNILKVYEQLLKENWDVYSLQRRTLDGVGYIESNGTKIESTTYSVKAGQEMADNFAVYIEEACKTIKEKRIKENGLQF